MGRNIRTELAKVLCSKCEMNWDDAVSVDAFSKIEHDLNCNLYLLNVDNLPILNTTATLFQSLLYKSEYNENYKQCWLLLNDNHYDVITKTTGFLACSHFCQKCCSCFNRKDTFEKHHAKCGKEEAFIAGKCTKGTFHKDAGHYLKRGICKGSKDEIVEKYEKSKNQTTKVLNKITEQMNNPRYIVYDFETDTSTNIHKPNLCEVSVLKVSDDHDFKKSFETSASFEGYDCLENFCNWLFQKANANSTVFAHNQAGYDGKLIYCPGVLITTWYLLNIYNKEIELVICISKI